MRISHGPNDNQRDQGQAKREIGYNTRGSCGVENGCQAMHYPGVSVMTETESHVRLGMDIANCNIGIILHDMTWHDILILCLLADVAGPFASMITLDARCSRWRGTVEILSEPNFVSIGFDCAFSPNHACPPPYRQSLGFSSFFSLTVPIAQRP